MLRGLPRLCLQWKQLGLLSGCWVWRSTPQRFRAASAGVTQAPETCGCLPLAGFQVQPTVPSQQGTRLGKSTGEPAESGGLIILEIVPSSLNMARVCLTVHREQSGYLRAQCILSLLQVSVDVIIPILTLQNVTMQIVLMKG